MGKVSHFFVKAGAAATLLPMAVIEVQLSSSMISSGIFYPEADWIRALIRSF